MSHKTILPERAGNPLEDQIHRDRDPFACFGYPSIVLRDGLWYFKTSWV